MGPRSFERGKKDGDWLTLKEYASLQWGRVRLNAESPFLRQAAEATVNASMGPRSFERGKDNRADSMTLTDRASMGPRSFERGKPKAAKGAASAVRSFNGAAFV